MREHPATSERLRLFRRWLSPLLDSRIAWPLCGLGVLVLIYGSLAPALAPPSAFQLDKLIHLVVYGGLATVGCLPCDRVTRGLPVAIMLIVLGGGIEIAQSFVPGRFPSVGDFIANTIGVLLGISLSRLLRRSLASWGEFRLAG